MKHLCISLLTFLFLFSFSFLSAQSIQGAWKIEKTEWVNKEGTTSNDHSDLASLILFTDTHYSYAASVNEKREPVPSESNRETMTEEQWKSIAQWYVSNSGTYTLKGNQLERTINIALFPNAMGNTDTAEVDIKSNKMTWKESRGEGENSWTRVTTFSRIK
jgi:hypothetical protein